MAQLLSSNISGTLGVTQNVNVAGNLIVSGYNVLNEIFQADNLTRVSANSGATQSAVALNFVNTSTVTVSVTSGGAGVANVAFTSTATGGGSGNLSNFPISSNSGSTVTANGVNFLNSAFILASVSSGITGNANVTLSLAENVTLTTLNVTNIQNTSSNVFVRNSRFIVDTSHLTKTTSLNNPTGTIHIGQSEPTYRYANVGGYGFVQNTNTAVFAADFLNSNNGSSAKVAQWMQVGLGNSTWLQTSVFPLTASFEASANLVITVNGDGTASRSTVTIRDFTGGDIATFRGNGVSTINQNLLVGSTNVAPAIASAANTTAVAANSGSILSAVGLNFINTATIRTSVVSGTGSNANVSFDYIGASTTTFPVSGNTGSTVSSSGLNFNNTSTIRVNVGTGIGGNSNISFDYIGVGGGGGNTFPVSANSGSTVTSNGLNFLNSSFITASISSGTTGNANVTLSLTENVTVTSLNVTNIQNTSSNVLVRNSRLIVNTGFIATTGSNQEYAPIHIGPSLSGFASNVSGYGYVSNVNSMVDAFRAINSNTDSSVGARIYLTVNPSGNKYVALAAKNLTGQILTGKDLTVTVDDSLTGGNLFVESGTAGTIFQSRGGTGITTFFYPVVISSSSASDTLRITQTGSGNSFVVEDETNPDSTPFVIDSGGNVGIGVAASQFYKLHALHTASNTASQEYAVWGNMYASSPSGSQSKIGVLGRSRSASGYGGTGPIIGVSGSANHEIAGVIPSVRAMSAAIQSNGSGTITDAYMYFSQDALLGTGGSNTITNLYGFYQGDLTTGNSDYGFYSAVSSGNNKWNFYSAGTANNYFNGSVGVGITGPTSKLHVVGDANITTGLIVSGINVTSQIAIAQNTTAVSANSGALISGASLNFNNTATIRVNVASGVAGNANISFDYIGSVTGGSGINTFPVSVNTASTVAANGLNFINSATVTVAVTQGIGGNANVTFTSVGGSATPSGSNTNIQYNNNGAFAGSNNLSYNAASQAISTNGNVIISNVGGLYFGSSQTNPTITNSKVLMQYNVSTQSLDVVYLG